MVVLVIVVRRGVTKVTIVVVPPFVAGNVVRPVVDVVLVIVAS